MSIHLVSFFYAFFASSFLQQLNLLDSISQPEALPTGRMCRFCPNANVRMKLLRAHTDLRIEDLSLPLSVFFQHISQPILHRIIPPSLHSQLPHFGILAVSLLSLLIAFVSCTFPLSNLRYVSHVPFATPPYILEEVNIWVICNVTRVEL